MSAISADLPVQRPLRADARRNHARIVEAAAAAFRDRGAAVQMEEVAKAAGVGVGTLYRHFPTKEALIAELIAARQATCVSDAEQAMAEHDAWTALETFVRGAAEKMASDAGLREAIASTQGLDSEALMKWKNCAFQHHQLQERLTLMLDRAKAEGTLRPDVTAPDLHALLGGMSGAIFHGGDWQLLTSIVLAGLRAAPASAG
jgi:AcrR family transcriptional regulator